MKDWITRKLLAFAKLINDSLREDADSYEELKECADNDKQIKHYDIKRRKAKWKR